MSYSESDGQVTLTMSREDSKIAVLFARADSIYKSMPECDVWDKERDALNWPGGSSVIAHPPCRLWGRLRVFANFVPGEKELAVWAVQQVRKWGGVLEHPHGSTLWDHCQLPPPGRRDEFGGWTIPIPQFWLGHKAEKATWFYIVGCEADQTPAVPMIFREPEYVVQSRKRVDYRPHIPKADRERTPFECCRWLIAIAKACNRLNQGNPNYTPYQVEKP